MPKNQRRVGSSARETATSEDVRHAIECLSDVDYARLMAIATLFARSRLRNAQVEPSDLLHDAITKTLDGRRTWNKRVSIVRHLDRVMESESGHILEKRTSNPIIHIHDGLIIPAAREQGPDATIQAVDQLQNLLHYFESDTEAKELLLLRGDGFSAAEIQSELGINKTKYETISKRIDRRLSKYLAGDEK